MNFPKPADKRPTLALPSKANLINKIEEREQQLAQRTQELADLEKQLELEREQLETRRHELEDQARALTEGELLLKNQKQLHQKQFARLMEQNDLEELRTELEQRQEELRRKEAFWVQTEKRLTEQFSAREQELAKREAWVSAEHEKASAGHNRRLQAIVFTDVVSYSALMQANESRTILQVSNDLQRMRVEGQAQGGLLINTMGDGMVMIFPSAIQAVRFSLTMQNAFNRSHDPGALKHRFGIHIADVALLPDGGIAGDGVNIAARLESKAPNGGICLSEIVYFIVKGKLALPPSSMEEITLKNIAEPVAVYKYTPEIIREMPDANGSTPPQAIILDEERTAPPFQMTSPVAARVPQNSLDPAVG